jgi:hypothetical protein
MEGGKEKAPAAMCRKAAETPDGVKSKYGVMANKRVPFYM